jgi:hypothetical protein
MTPTRGIESSKGLWMVDTLDVDTFVENYLTPGRPVLVRGADTGWSAPAPWSLSSLRDRFGDRKVPLYDTLFQVNSVSTFARYLGRYTGREPSRDVPPYLRWFVRQSPMELPWSDEVFAELASDWTAPGWLPDTDFAFPRRRRTDHARDPFPGKGLFVCGQGGRTRLHRDPWATDAILLQTTGLKRVTLFAPEQGHLLTNGGAVVDLDRPDDERFPRWRSAEPVLEETLHPGQTLFIPADWYHTAVALEDSVSITWNFVHRTHERRFTEYLDGGGAADPVVGYFRSRELD